MQAHKRNPRFQSGEFEPFKMLIGAIMALVVLVIILAAIEFFYSFQVSVSAERFYTSIRNAIEQPNGKTLEIKTLRFESGTVFTSGSLGRQIGLEAQCLLFDSRSTNSGIIAGTESVQIASSIELDAFAVCRTNVLDPSCSCQVCCEIGFNVDPSSAP